MPGLHSSQPFGELLKRAGFVGVVGMLLLLGNGLWGQQTTADVLGTVTDASGAILPGITITVHNLDTGADSSSTSDSTGNYMVRLVPVGR